MSGARLTLKYCVESTPKRGVLQSGRQFLPLSCFCFHSQGLPWGHAQAPELFCSGWHVPTWLFCNLHSLVCLSTVHFFCFNCFHRSSLMTTQSPGWKLWRGLEAGDGRAALTCWKIRESFRLLQYSNMLFSQRAVEGRGLCAEKENVKGISLLCAFSCACR